MTWHKFMLAAVEQHHPGASPLTDFIWMQDGPNALPTMVSWNADKLGPLDLPALQATAEELADRGYVPEKVTRAQALQALNEAELLEQVEAVVAAYNDRAISIWFKDAGTWERNNPYVWGIALEIGLTETQVDDLFKAAALYG